VVITPGTTANWDAGEQHVAVKEVEEHTIPVAIKM
jgi:hypothetical protein